MRYSGIFLPLVLVVACDDCPKGMTKVPTTGSNYRCADLEAEAKRAAAIESARVEQLEKDRKKYRSVVSCLDSAGVQTKGDKINASNGSIYALSLLSTEKAMLLLNLDTEDSLTVAIMIIPSSDAVEAASKAFYALGTCLTGAAQADVAAAVAKGEGQVKSAYVRQTLEKGNLNLYLGWSKVDVADFAKSSPVAGKPGELLSAPTVASNVGAWATALAEARKHLPEPSIPDNEEGFYRLGEVLPDTDVRYNTIKKDAKNKWAFVLKRDKKLDPRLLEATFRCRTGEDRETYDLKTGALAGTVMTYRLDYGLKVPGAEQTPKHVYDISTMSYIKAQWPNWSPCGN